MLDIVKTNYGLIQGLPGNNQFITVFKGIPFAKPPVGNLRWKAPEDPEPWEGILTAYKYKNIPWQDRFSSEGVNTLASSEFYVRDYTRDEDCLYLNIFTPAKSSSDNLPVCIYIHGGGFETGYSYLNAYDGESFAKEGIVFVTITYRLNAFGFLATEELLEEDLHSSTGNYGTLDQIKAINWVKENIQSFGGNPNDITLMGQSAGGASVQNMCQTELTNNYFNKAIMQSGGGLNYHGPLEPLDLNVAIRRGEEFLNYLNVKTIKEARQLNAEYILNKYLEFKKANDNILLFLPTIDNYVFKEDSYSFFIKGYNRNIKFLIGSVADEMRNKNLFLSNSEKLLYAKNRFKNMSSNFIDYIMEDDVLPNKYFQDLIGSEIISSGIAFCENEANKNNRLCYLYHFKYIPPGAEDVGAHHSVEHHYVFQTLNRSFRNYTLKDYALSLNLSKAWANFIKKGDPNTKNLKWNPYNQNKEILIIDDKIKLEKYKFPKNIEFLVDYFLNK